MNNLNEFFRKLYSSPVLMWKASAALIFFSIGIAICAVPSLTTGLTAGIRYGFGSMLMVYGVFRFWTFYTDINSRRRDE